MPIMPRWRGCAAGKEPRPSSVLATGMPWASANAITSVSAAAWAMPWPARMTGFWEPWMRATASRMAEDSARSMGWGRWGVGAAASKEKGAVACWASLVMSTRTGPGRPCCAIWKARRTAGAMSSARVTRKLCLVMGRVMPVMSTSWKASEPRTLDETWPVIATTGMLSSMAVARPVTRLVAPGPEVAMQTPTRPDGYPGGAILPIYDALRKFPIHHVLVRHEQGAAHMADGYARASGRTGVCMATSGPGATNLVTGIATAMLDSIPIVAITGQVSSKVLGSDAFQEVDITGITLPITKHNFLVTRAEDIAPTVRLAFQIASHGRPGPVLVDITKDAQQGTAPFSFAAAAPPVARPHPMLRATSNSIQQAVELLLAAKKPVILAGHGITQSGAESEVLALAERLAIPIASTLLGLGAIPTDHPLSLGMMGMHGESWVNHAIQQSDLLIALGMRFDDRVTGNLAHYAPIAKRSTSKSTLPKSIRTFAPT